MNTKFTTALALALSVGLVVFSGNVSASPTAWEIAEKMLAECAGSKPYNGRALFTGAEVGYMHQLYSNVIETHPDLGNGDFMAGGHRSALANDGDNPNPFARRDVDLQKFLENGEIVRGGNDNYMPTYCEGFVLIFMDIPENNNGDGILEGEAYLFYEVGGTQPLFLDGELREVSFTFPPVP